jgi:hypothetical protein
MYDRIGDQRKLPADRRTGKFSPQKNKILKNEGKLWLIMGLVFAALTASGYAFSLNEFSPNEYSLNEYSLNVLKKNIPQKYLPRILISSNNCHFYLHIELLHIFNHHHLIMSEVAFL